MRAARAIHCGEIVGRPGIFCIKSGLSELKKSLAIDVVIANTDGATSGFGVGKTMPCTYENLALIF